MKKNYILSIIAFMLLAVSYVSSQTIYPSMDTFIHQNGGGGAGTPSTTDYGTQLNLEVRNSTTLGRITFMDINLSTISSFSSVSSAMLNLYLQSAASSTDNVEVYLVTAQNVPIVSSSTWTLLNPSGVQSYTLGSSLASITVTNGDAVNTKYSFNITSFISSLAPGTQKVTLCFKATTTAGPKDFWSADNGNVSYNPALVVTTSSGVVAVTGVTVSPSSATVAVGATSNLSATIAPSNATNASVNWTSSNTAIATVSTTGVVTGVAVGSADITATTVDGSFTSKSTITVVNIPVTEVTVSPNPATVVAGAYITLTAIIAPTNASNKIVIWTTSNPTIARVSDSGVVTGIGAGTATITAITQDGSFTSTSSITVSAASSNYALNPDFEVNAAPAASATNWYEWSATAGNIDNSSLITGNVGLGNVVGGAPHSGTYYIAIAPTVAKPTGYDVLNKQDLTGLPNGIYTLKVWFRANGGSGYLNVGGTYNSFNTATMSQWTQYTINNISVTNGTATININYTSNPGGYELDIDDVQLTLNQFFIVTGINAVSPASKTLSLNETTTLTTTTIPSNASNNVINWSSSNTGVATVTAFGVVTAVSAGTATITANTAEGSYKSTSAITVANNYVLNPGFELDTAPYNLSPTNWYKWGPNAANGNVVTGNNSLGDAIGGTPHSGTNYLEFAGSGTYEVDIKQDISGLPNGTYTLKFWCRGNNASGGYHDIKGDYTGWGTLASQWTQQIITNVNVSTGATTLNIIYNTTTGGSLNIDDVELTLNGVATSMPSVENYNNVSILPSVVTNNVLNISTTDKGIYEVSIVNISGQTMYQNKLNSGNVSINTSFLKKGMYLVRVSNGIENSVQKVIIQ